VNGGGLRARDVERERQEAYADVEDFAREFVFVDLVGVLVGYWWVGW
jgi:hypothetical protein